MVATGVADCYYNVADLPTGAAYRFRVACVNKAGQGPYSNLSEKITLDSTGAQKRLPSSVVSQQFNAVGSQSFTKQTIMFFEDTKMTVNLIQNTVLYNMNIFNIII